MMHYGLDAKAFPRRQMNSLFSMRCGIPYKTCNSESGAEEK
jgi:hypothetical protein